jgi:ubiquinone/menaquinone biosynthesis C-methylase UbiE
MSLAVCAGVVGVAAVWGRTQTQPPTTRNAGGSESKTDPKINEPFKKPDVKEYIKRFESEERETFARRGEIVAALELAPGMTLADVGAGTGLFTRLFADKVGPAGRVYAVDISPRFLDHIAAESKKRGQTNVITLLGSQNTTNLPRGSVDLVFLCDVYHHLEKPEKTLASIREALKQRGELVVVDFDKVEGRSSEFVLKHVRAPKAVFVREIEAAGFQSVGVAKPPVLKENFFLRYRKSATRAERRD